MGIHNKLKLNHLEIRDSLPTKEDIALINVNNIAKYGCSLFGSILIK